VGLIEGVCKACSSKMRTLEAAKEEGLTLLDDMSGHPSLAGYRERVRNYYVLIRFLSGGQCDGLARFSVEEGASCGLPNTFLNNTHRKRHPVITRKHPKKADWNASEG